MAGLVMSAAVCGSASALTIELKDVAADRIERQRAAAAGALPLAGTPNVAILDRRLKEKKLAATAAMMIRVFKSESELEVWKERDGKFVLFATYPICHWSGSLGPKLREGDRQTPEGFYAIDRSLSRGSMRWPQSLNIGYPNLLEQSQAQTGSHILIHGGCSSVGCFAMTNPVMEEIYDLALASLNSGQSHIPVHVFPFRMTKDNMTKHAASPWSALWTNLKKGYDIFEAERRPPRVSACDGRYQFESSRLPQSLPTTIEACAGTLTAIRENRKWLRDIPSPSMFNPPEDAFPEQTRQTGRRHDRQSYYNPAVGNPGARTSGKGSRAIAGIDLKCSLKRASCRKFLAAQRRIATRKVRQRSRVAERRNGSRRTANAGDI